jgi:flagellar biogenesis protein FliO
MDFNFLTFVFCKSPAYQPSKKFKDFMRMYFALLFLLLLVWYLCLVLVFVFA